MDSIRDRYLRVCDKVNRIAIKASRSPSDVKLVVVTKKQPVEKILQVIEAGATLLGENYPEDIHEKITRIPANYQIQWHMIGHIQSRKIKHILNYCNYVHCVDRLEIAKKLDNACRNLSIVLPVLIEVNIIGEDNKFGYSINTNEEKEELFLDIEAITQLKCLKLRGFMTIPPVVSKPEQNQFAFIKCRELLEEAKTKLGLKDFDQLSMGTSQDYESAIQEGATFIRVGEAIMGERNSV